MKDCETFESHSGVSLKNVSIHVCFCLLPVFVFSTSGAANHHGPLGSSAEWLSIGAQTGGR